MSEKDLSNVALVFSYFNEIGIISQLSTNAFERGLPEAMTMSQFTVLNWFSRVDTRATPGRLSSALMVSKGAMTNTLGKLQAKGLITVRPDKQNARQKNVRMTAKGKRMRERCLDSASVLLSEVGEVFDAKRLAKQLPELKDMREYLDKRRR